jgi:hypothetical protein
LTDWSYAALAEAANTFRGLLGEGARVIRGEGERATTASATRGLGEMNRSSWRRQARAKAENTRRKE